MEDTTNTTEHVEPAAPYLVTGGLLRAQVITGLGQLIAAVGAIIGFLGLGERTWIVRIYTFARSNEAAPVITVLAWVIAAVWLIVRSRRLKIERAVMAALVSNRIAMLTGKVHPTIRAAIDQTIQERVIGASPSRTKGL